LANAEAGLQNSQETVDEEDYVGDTQMVSSDATFPQGNPYSSEHKSVVFHKTITFVVFHVLPEKLAFVIRELTA
jgi:hypothetical protein